jgi:hypothetical protein
MFAGQAQPQFRLTQRLPKFAPKRIMIVATERANLSTK